MAYVREVMSWMSPGNVVTSAWLHEGSLVMTVTGDYDQLMVAGLSGYPQADLVRTEVWDVAPNAVTSEVGSVDGSDNPVDACLWVLGSDRRFLYLGGRHSVWRYDPSKHAVEQILNDRNAFGWQSGKPGVHQYVRWAAAGSALGFVSAGSQVTVSKNPLVGVDLKPNQRLASTSAHYQLISNLFDFGLPHEFKYITQATIATEPIPAGDNTTIVLYVSADDGPFVEMGTHSQGQFTAMYPGRPPAGRRFQYAVVYLTPSGSSVTARYGITSVMFKAVSGEMVTSFKLRIKPQALSVGSRALDAEENVQQLGELRGAGHPDAVPALDVVTVPQPGAADHCAYRPGEHDPW